MVGHRGRGAKVAPALRVRSTDDRLDLLRGRRRARLALHELAQRGAVDRAGAVGGHLGKEVRRSKKSLQGQIGATSTAVPTGR